jgi:membrane-associated phospholipid phosphatase
MRASTVKHRLSDQVIHADERVFRAVAEYRNPPLDAVLPGLSLAVSYSRIWIGISAILVLLGGRRERIAAAEGILAVAITSFLAILVLKRAIPRQRPKDPVPRARELPDPDSSSFPSGHTASGAAFSSAVGRALPRSWIPLNTIAAAVGFSLVYIGVHHPSDVAVGWILGKAVAAAVRRSRIVPKLVARYKA